MYEAGEKWLAYGLAVAAGFVLCLMATDTSASIVNDPVALEQKLEEMREARMEKFEANEKFWEDYRRRPEVAKNVQVCSRVYTEKGVYRKCRWEVRYVKS